MKTKISKILGVVLTIVVLTSLLVVAAPVSAADPLEWGTEYGPSSSSTTNTRVSGSDVTDIAVGNDGTTIWAVDATGNHTFKSTNGGSKWARKTISALDAPSLVAIAPDDNNIVVVGGDTNELYLSTNGGTTFSALTGHGLTNIYAIAISPASGSTHYIAAGGTDSGGVEVAYFNLGATVPKWTSAYDGSGWDNDSFGTADRVSAVAFSPAFASDKVMVVVTGNTTGAALFSIASFSSKKWNSNAGFAGYPVTLESSADVVNSASISLAPTYLGADSAERLAFVGLAASNGGLYRLTNTTKKQLASTTISAVHSVAYDGTNLVAGAYGSNLGYYSSNPLSSVPTVKSNSTYQKPGGASKTVVAWAGENVVAGTTGASSAFAVSKDNGKTYNDISLIDAATTNINDIALSADGSTLYMVTDDGTYLSVWRKQAGSWERIFNLTDTGYIIRLAPEDASYVYLIDAGQTTTMYYSNDSGETKWMLRAATSTPVDAAVESAETIYILNSSGSVYKSTNGGFTWGPPRATGLGNGYTIVSVSKDNLLVGGTGGNIAYSTDGSASSTTWKTKTLSSYISGNVQVAASGLTSSDYIYAAGDGDADIYRWKVGSKASGDLKDIATVTGAVRGMVLQGSVLYALTDNSSDSSSRVYRNITPSSPVASLTWDNVSVTANFNKTPQALEVTTGSNKLWAIDNESTDGLKSFIDDTFDTGPTLASPANGAVLVINPVTGRAGDQAFSWKRVSKSTAYSVDIALDSAFKEKVISGYAKSSTSSTVVQVFGPNQGSGNANTYEFMPGVTYYWRVKATSPVRSPYSETRSFTYQSLEKKAVFDISGPSIGASDVGIKPVLSWAEYEGAIRYQLEVSEDPSFKIIEFSHNVDNTFYGVTEAESLDYSTTYYWRVRGITAEPYTKRRSVVVPAGPWATGVFTTVAEPVVSEPAVVTVTEPAPPPEIKVIEVPTKTTEVVPQAIPNWMLLTIIIIGAVLVIALIVLIVRTRRVA